jgi:lysophospholipase L1-like esterase
MKKTILMTCLVALLAAAPAMAQVDLSNYVALGDSLTAGFASGALMDFYQDRSYPAVLAAQAGATGFEQPLVSEPGFPPILELVHLVPVPVIQPVGLVPGLPVNAALPRPYNNLGVPGATLFDMLFATGDINNLAAGNFDNVMNDLILRDGIHTALEQAIGLQPTFITVGIGNNDELGAVAVATPIDGVTMTPVAIFEQLYNNAIGALVTNTSADIVLMNLPYSTLIPFATTVPPFVDIPGLGLTPLMGTKGPLTPDSQVTLLAGGLIAQGYGLPGGPPLPEDLDFLTGEPGYVLRPEEIDIINDRVDAFNAIIADVADTYGLAVFDTNAFFNRIAAGEAPSYGGVEINAGFLLGGFFSYDGVHPQRIGYAMVADALAQFINAEFGNTIPRVNMAEVLYEGDWQTPWIEPAAVKDVVLSREGFAEVLKLFAPKLSRTPRIRRPGSGRSDLPNIDVRRKPELRR